MHLQTLIKSNDWRFFIGDPEVETAVKFEQSIACAAVFSIMIGKLSHWQQTSLVVLFIVDKSLKISFYCTILAICLAISLRVEGNRESLLNTQKVTEQLPKAQCKNLASVNDDFVKQIMVPHYHINKDFCKAGGIN